jgi:tetratricopeptide (TPR) repeat protein
MLVLGTLGGLVAEKVRQAELLRVSGVVKVRRAGTVAWYRAVLPEGRVLHPRDEVQTYQKSSAALSLDGARLELGPLTHIIIPGPAAVPQREAFWRLNIITGKLLIWLIGARPMEIGTAGVVAGVRGTRFVMEVTADGLTTCSVLAGTVEFYNEAGRVVLQANQQSSAAPGQAPTRPARFDASQFLEWEASLESVWLGHERSATPPTGPQAGALTEGYDLLEQGRLAEAETLFRGLAAAAPQAAAPLAGLAVAQAAGGEQGLTAAVETLRRAAALPGTDPEVAVAAVLVAWRQGDREALAGALERAGRLASQDHRVVAYRALAALVEGQGEAALSAARQAVMLAPQSALAHESLGRAAFYAGDLGEARQAADKAVALGPRSASAHLLAAEVAAAEGKLEAALRESEQAVVLDPTLAPAYSTLGMVALALGNLSQAHKAFTRAVELRPGLTAAQTGLGLALKRQGKLAEALATQQAAVSADGGHAAARNNLGAVYLSLGRLTEAVAEFQQALALQAGWALPRANLALAYLELNRFAEALQQANMAVAQGERSARVYTTLARVYLKQERLPQAAATLRLALEIDPHYALARMHLAEVYTRQGRSREAVQERLQAMSSQPSAMLDGRAYARTELQASAASSRLRLKTEGVSDSGHNSYYLAAERLEDDWDRPRTEFRRESLVALAGRQTEARRTQLLYLTAERDQRDRPGIALAGGAPEDLDDRGRFVGSEAHYLTRTPVANEGNLTLKLGYRTITERLVNPDSLNPDPDPWAALKLQYSGPVAELRWERPVSDEGRLVAGVAGGRERRGQSGLLTLAGAPPTTLPFANTFTRDLLSAYVDYEQPLRADTRLLVGGRLATAEGSSPVLRPRVALSRQRGTSTWVLLTRPLLADDLAELAPVDRWETSRLADPTRLARGGFSQSYELHYQQVIAGGSLWHLAVYQRDLRNALINLQDPAWQTAGASPLLGAATLRGAEAEMGRRVGKGLNLLLRARYMESDNPGAGGREVPYVPQWQGRARLNYLDAKGYRAALSYDYLGQRYADLANATRLEAYGLVSASVARQFNLHTDVFVNVENALDRDNQYYQGYPGRGRHVEAGVLYRF